MVCQIGAREHYVLAASLRRKGRLLALFTEVWAPPGSFWRLLASAVEHLKYKNAARAIEGRYLNCHLTVCSPSAFRWIIWRLFCGRFEQDDRFSSWAARRIKCLAEQKPGTPIVVFSYSYGARQIAKAAKEVGAPFILGQIDGGPEEMSLVRGISRQHGVSVDGDWRDAEYWQSWRDECEFADVILVNSRWALQLLIKAGVNDKKCVILPLAYDPTDRVTKAKIYPLVFTIQRPMRVLYLGQVTARKGIVELCGAMRLLEDQPIELRIVGPVQSGIDTRGVGCKSITWLGSSPRASVGEHYSWADIFILPTHSDGFAITQLEAQAHALPIISSPFCGEVVQHEINGLRISAVTPEAIADALRWAAGHPQALGRMSTQSILDVHKYSSERIVEELCKIVDALHTSTKGACRHPDGSPATTASPRMLSANDEEADAALTSVRSPIWRRLRTDV